MATSINTTGTFIPHVGTLTVQEESHPPFLTINEQDPSALEQTAPVSQEKNPLYITEIALTILSYCDLRTLQSLACVDRFFNACVQAHDEQLDLERLCPNLRILDAKAQGLTINDEPTVSKGWILKNYTELEPHVENGEGLTLLTMPKGRTLESLITIAAEAGITVSCWDQMMQEHGNFSVEQTYVILITNNLFQQSRNKSYVKQQEIVAGHRCVMPTVQEYVALCVFTNKVFQKCLYRENPRTYGRTSMLIYDSYRLVVGGSTTAHLRVSCANSNDEIHGAGGQRKFGH